MDKKHRIYVKRPNAAPVVFGFGAPRGEGREGLEAKPVAAKPGLREELPREADRILLARYAPAGVIVDERDNIVEFRGQTEPYLEHPHGRASLNLFRMARKGLLLDDPPGDPGSQEEETRPSAGRTCRCVTGARSAGWTWR